MYEVKVAGVVREPLTSRFIMLLEAVKDGQDIMIPVGKFEAESISSRRQSNGCRKKTPYDILSSVLEWVDSVGFQKLVIDDCSCGIYTAKLYMERNGVQNVMDCRPSDGVYFALDRSIPIYVSRVLSCPEP
jgi:bifunctional DNase/RNase